ncbi:PAS domain-containing sensor histidine kinase [Schlesneria paludicola]|uniref:PAS domain-containing sensor histidine kinase n=1 Tax=Schlesneria paludicola TaxID=360056 RepID=UPI00029AAFC4|nr:ATP-binding protein [Schlesneria paludicola]
MDLDSMASSQAFESRFDVNKMRHVALGVLLLIVTCAMDAFRPFDRSWSMLYILVLIYVGTFVRGRAEFLLYAGVVLAAFLVPPIFRMESVRNTALFQYRVLGAIAGFGLIWSRRRVVMAMRQAHLELENKVVVRTAEIRATNESLRTEIAERKLTAAKLSESKELFSVAIDSIQEGFMLVTRDGRVQICNRSAERILGLAQTPVSACTSLHSCWRAINEDGSELGVDAHPAKICLKNGVPQCDVVMGVYQPSEELVWISVNAVPIGPTANPSAVAVTFSDITKRKLAEDELRESRVRLEYLSRQLISTRESELKHFARELHDEIGQLLTAMKLNLRRSQDATETSVNTRVLETMEMIDRAIGQVRNLSLNLRPPHLNELGLVAALHWYLRQQADLAGIQTKIDVNPVEIQIPQDLAIVCFRISQEAITNALRHSGAKRIDVDLRLRNDELYLAIHDDGNGFNVAKATAEALEGASMGLITMQERAGLMRGHLDIESEAGRGTTVHVWFPLASSH